MTSRSKHPTLRTWMTACSLLILMAASVGAVAPDDSQGHAQRNFDARVQHNQGFVAPSGLAQNQGLEQLRAALPDLAVTFEPTTGATRTLYNRTGYLTEATRLSVNASAIDLAVDFVADNLTAFGLTADDLLNLEVTDEVFTAATGATHLYLRQTHQGLAVYNGQLHVNVNRDGRILSVNNAFMPSLASAVNRVSPRLTAVDAVLIAAADLGLDVQGPPQLLGQDRGGRQWTQMVHKQLSQEEIKAQLMWLPIRQGDARLVWNFQLYLPDGSHYYDINVDAVGGDIWTRFDWVNSGSYRVYEQPVESPNHTSPAPPADARTLAVNPEDATASPSGWFTGGIMSGNNVHACLDANANNGCDTPEPSCSGTTCDFSINLAGSPSTYTEAAISNLFYWNNIIHDIQYQYGFDEAGGNFQENNFGNGGAGSDSVNADAQDGSGNCNANFATPTDGSNPRMQMFTCDIATPVRDGDFDNAVIVHEYGHGISIRQVGGPSNSSCLNNSQQAGEGWSDWLGLVYTAEAGDVGTEARGMGTYLFGEPANGPGIRDLPYSTDPSVNTWTYESISGAGIPHGVGSRWAQAAWEVYWALVDAHGFDADLGANTGAGNHRAMLYINEGLKNTACSPTFVDNRDGIIQAVTDNYGGEDLCLVWEAFADFGLGTNAVSGGSNSTNPTNGFDVPLACQCDPAPIADAGPDQAICQGDSVTIGTAAQPSNSYSWAPGGQTAAQISVSPAATTTYTVTATTSCGSADDSVTVNVDDGTTGIGLSDDFEGSVSDWTATGLWHQVSNSSCASPGYSSATSAFYYGQDSTCNYSTGAATTGTLTSPAISGINGSSTLTFDYYRVVESFSGDYDRTQVNILTSSGSTTVFSLNSSNASTAAWVSSGAIDLSAFAGQIIQVQFVFNSVDSVSNTFTGWLVDDVVVTGESNCTGPGNTAPTVSITAPADGSDADEGTSVTFSGTANDTEDGNLSGSLSWSSNLDGGIGSGASFSTSGLSVGTHVITASVTDSGGLSGSDAISLTINDVSQPPVTVTFTSIGAEDGWVRESNENSGVGGAANPNGAGARPIRPGDGTQDRQYKSILSFDTSSIPAGATIQSATLRLRRGTVRGSNPFTNGFGQCLVDVNSGGFSGSTAIQGSDFQAPATATAAAALTAPASNGDWSEGVLNAAGVAAVNASGTTQFRVYFEVDDNDNGADDHMGYYSGDNSNAANHPQLVVTYQP